MKNKRKFIRPEEYTFLTTIGDNGDSMCITDDLAKALEMLIAAKDHKEKYGKDESYNKTRQDAWAFARKTLTKYKELQL